MRLHRLSLRSYRGVASCDLTFAEHGITVVEGDNEAGKSSAAEALHLLLEYRDDSSHRRVQAVKPLHHDAGAEVEAELSADGLRFTYRKRWHRDHSTQLRITGPRPEVVTGRAAHDRVRELLAQSVDLELWRALSAPQGAALERPELRDHPSVVAALDQAAGGALGTPGESDLVERASSEAGRWATPLGRPKAPLVDLRRRAADADRSVAEHQAAIEALDADVTWCADLERRVADLAPRSEALALAASVAAAEAVEVRERHAEVENLAVAARLAASEAVVAGTGVAGRAALVAGVEAAEAATLLAGRAVDAADRAAEVSAAELSDAVAAAAAAAGEAEAAAAAAAATEAVHLELRRAAATAQVASQLAELESALGVVGRLRADIARDEQALAANPSSPDALAAVQEAHDEALKAEAAAAAARPTVRLEALRHLDVLLDGEPEAIGAGATTDHVVADRLVIELSEHVRVTVAAGAAAGVLEARHRQARQVLVDRCERLGVDDLQHARLLEDERRALVTRLSSQRAGLGDALGGRQVGDLVHLVDQARQELAATGSPAPGPAPTAEALEAARARWEDACQRSRLACRASDRAADQAAVAEGSARRLRQAQEHADAGLAVARGDLRQRLDRLGAARASTPDAALVDAAAAATVHARVADGAWREAAAQVDDGELQRALQTAQRAAVERDGAARALAELREDLAGIRSRLQLQGEGGLHERLAEARRLATAVAAELRSAEERAAASALLLATLTRHRDEAARAYGAPMRAELERLGALVFGDDFAVELDDELRISRRILGGDPVPWSELSVGAREQLSVLSRLAAAVIVSADGGVPVVFDDVLGFTDPGRLERMAAAFADAAGRCQIIVLTCEPSRYRHLARATTLSLARPRGVPARQAG
ncbi:MAG: hypothetical protein AVDCRST_MAG20-2257 [uncultured Acidimicrobiales bacterium]|uniref:YhaN AAA domain-containing protein n=1 Tax=uncultured Acidimicrobiales bacterium TaxID=310071 RepID=A0A6J4IHA0_9ACTN|nr:MAG: hypothetical protein AVDCRST_MAG20-2257 [uncultured Acidimicrobiales bacterium]